MASKQLIRTVLMALGVSAVALTMSGCSTAPDYKDRTSFKMEARGATQWFESNVRGLDRQIANSGGYVTFPGVGQWGFLFGGGKFGRGVVSGPDRSQAGWAAINTGSVGLQVGVQGMKMLIVFEDDGVMRRFKEGKLSGSVAAVGVVGGAGGSAAAQFTEGVAIYQGGNTGVMAGANVGLDLMRYEPMTGGN